MSAKRGLQPARANPWDYETICCRTVNWSPESGRFRCRSCGRISDKLRDKTTGTVATR